MSSYNDQRNNRTRRRDPEKTGDIITVLDSRGALGTLYIKGRGGKMTCMVLSFKPTRPHNPSYDSVNKKALVVDVYFHIPDWG